MSALLKIPSKDVLRGIIQFLKSDGKTPIEIHRELTRKYGQTVMSIQHVRKWCRLFDEGRTNLEDEPRSGRPSVLTDVLVQRVETFIQENRRVTISDLEGVIPVSRRLIHQIVTEKLQYRKLCARWVPKMLTDTHKTNRFTSSLTILQKFNIEGNDFLQRIVTGDETWVYYKTPETKEASKQWKHHNSPGHVKFKKENSARKLMVSVFWDSEGVLLVDFMTRGTTINGEAYRNTLRKLRTAIKNKRPGKLSRGIELLHDNARPHTAAETVSLIKSFKWNIVNHPAYSPDLAPSDYHLFPNMKSHFAGSDFDNDEEIKDAVMTYLKSLDANFYEEGISKLIHRCDKCINRLGNYVEK